MVDKSEIVEELLKDGFYNDFSKIEIDHEMTEEVKTNVYKAVEAISTKETGRRYAIYTSCGIQWFPLQQSPRPVEKYIRLVDRLGR